jgi:hypothetical protein
LLCQCSCCCSNRHWWPVHSRNGRHCFVRTSRLLLRWWRCVFLGGTRALHGLSIVFTNNVCVRRASSIAPVPQQALSCTVPLLCRLSATLTCLLHCRLCIGRVGQCHCSIAATALSPLHLHLVQRFAPNSSVPCSLASILDVVRGITQQK